jgi:hypothetical protein
MAFFIVTAVETSNLRGINILLDLLLSSFSTLKMGQKVPPKSNVLKYSVSLPRGERQQRDCPAKGSNL